MRYQNVALFSWEIGTLCQGKILGERKLLANFDANTEQSMGRHLAVHTFVIFL